MAKKELISATKKRYLKVGKKGKGKLLDEFCANSGLARKYAIKILSAKYDCNRVLRFGRKGRKRKYGHDFMIEAIKIWEVLDYPCGQRLKPALPEMYATLARFKEINFDEKINEQLKTVSGKTLDRHLEKERRKRCLKKNRGMTCRGSLLKSAIPVRLTNWDTAKLGFTEIDTVAHNGGDPAGLFAYTLDSTEIYSGWTEQWATMGKGEAGVLEALKSIRKSLPFKLLGIDGDNGGEIVNYHMLKYCQAEKLVYTRSRPEMKNDNAYVEQKNYTHVRKLVGYHRYDQAEQIKLMNDLYRNEYRLFTNFFRPIMKIKSKEKINNSVCKKKYDEAKSPYQRLMACEQISKEEKERLTALYLSLNPLQLRRAIIEKTAKLKLTVK
ncbi:MAG TPA: transposase [Patescibacteria group bacterium]|nr:transposase [Patescibacteria group bacterium]